MAYATFVSVHHFLGTVRGLYLSYFLFQSIWSLHLAHTPATGFAHASFIRLLRPCRPALYTVTFWCRWPFLVRSPLRRLAIQWCALIRIKLLVRSIWSKMATEDQTAEEAKRIATTTRDNDGEESGRLCDAFLDRFSGMMNHSSVEKILKEQARM